MTAIPSRYVVPAAAVVLCAALMMPSLGGRSLWFDEGVSTDFAQVSLAQLWAALHHVDANFALYYATLHEWRIFGTSDVAVRSLSFVAALGTVVAGYALAREMFGGRVAAISAAILAVTPFLVTMGTQARPYTLMLCFATCATYAFVRALETPNAVRLTVYAALSVVAIYWQAFAALLLVAHLWSLIVLERERSRAFRWVATYAVIGLAVVPVVWMLHVARDADQLYWLPKPGLRDVWNVLRDFYVSPIAAALALAAAGVAVVATPRGERRGVAAVLLWFVIPLLASFAISRALQPMFLARYLIELLVPLSILAAIGLARLRPRFVAFAVSALVVVWCGRIDLHAMETPREDYRGAIAFAEQTGPRGRTIIAYPPGAVYAIDGEKPPDAPAPIIYPVAGWHYWIEKANAIAVPPRSIFNGHARVTAIVRTNDKVAFDAWQRLALATYRRGAVKHFAGVDVVEYEKAAEAIDDSLVTVQPL